MQTHSPFSRRLKQTVAAAVALCLVGTSAPWVEAAQALSVPSDVAQLRLPNSLGQVIEHYDGDPSKTRPSIILIQDLHAHYGVQKNIAGILEFLSKKLPSSLRAHRSSLPFVLAVEGASGPVENSVMALFPDKKIKQATADYLMREGELSGAEYFSIVRGLPNVLVGVEQEDYYRLHRDLFRQTLKSRERLVALLRGLRVEMASLRPRIYSSELKKFQRRLDAFEEGRMGIDEAVAWLTAEAQRFGMDTSGLQRRKNDHILQDIDSLALILKLQEAKTPAEKDLIQVEHDLALLLSVADLRATEEEVRSFGPRLNQFVAMADSLLRSRLTPVSEKKSVASLFPEADLREIVSSSIDYYAMAMMRNKPMVENTLALIGQGDLKPQTLNLKNKKTGQALRSKVSDLRFEVRDQTDVAVLIAGGFHTAPITQLLREKHISYAVITPTVDSLTDADHALYVKRLSGDLLTEEQILAAGRDKRSALVRSIEINRPYSLARSGVFHRSGDGLAIGLGIVKNRTFWTAALVVTAVSLGLTYTDALAQFNNWMAPFAYQNSDALQWVKESSQLVMQHPAVPGSASVLTVIAAAAGSLSREGDPERYGTLFDGLGTYDAILAKLPPGALREDPRRSIERILTAYSSLKVIRYQTRLHAMSAKKLSGEFKKWAKLHPSKFSRYLEGDIEVKTLREWLESPYHVLNTPGTVVQRLTSTERASNISKEELLEMGLEAAFLHEVFKRWQEKTAPPAGGLTNQPPPEDSGALSAERPSQITRRHAIRGILKILVVGSAVLKGNNVLAFSPAIAAATAPRARPPAITDMPRVRTVDEMVKKIFTPIANRLRFAFYQVEHDSTRPPIYLLHLASREDLVNLAGRVMMGLKEDVHQDGTLDQKDGAEALRRRLTDSAASQKMVLSLSKSNWPIGGTAIPVENFVNDYNANHAAAAKQNIRVNYSAAEIGLYEHLEALGLVECQDEDEEGYVRSYRVKTPAQIIAVPYYSDATEGALKVNIGHEGQHAAAIGNPEFFDALDTLWTTVLTPPEQAIVRARLGRLYLVGDTQVGITAEQKKIRHTNLVLEFSAYGRQARKNEFFEGLREDTRKLIEKGVYELEERFAPFLHRGVSERAANSSGAKTEIANGPQPLSIVYRILKFMGADEFIAKKWGFWGLTLEISAFITGFSYFAVPGLFWPLAAAVVAAIAVHSFFHNFEPHRPAASWKVNARQFLMHLLVLSPYFLYFLLDNTDLPTLVHHALFVFAPLVHLAFDLYELSHEEDVPRIIGKSMDMKSPEPWVFALIDFDNGRSFNDYLGKFDVDKGYFQRLKRLLRQHYRDILGGRIGGDENGFVISGTAEKVQRRMDELRTAFGQVNPYPDKTILDSNRMPQPLPRMTLSMGLVTRDQILTHAPPEILDDPTALFELGRELAALALKAAKDERGKDAVVMYSDDLKRTSAAERNPLVEGQRARRVETLQNEKGGGPNARVLPFADNGLRQFNSTDDLRKAVSHVDKSNWPSPIRPLVIWILKRLGLYRGPLVAMSIEPLYSLDGYKDPSAEKGREVYSDIIDSTLLWSGGKMLNDLYGYHGYDKMILLTRILATEDLSKLYAQLRKENKRGEMWLVRKAPDTVQVVLVGFSPTQKFRDSVRLAISSAQKKFEGLLQPGLKVHLNVAIKVDSSGGHAFGQLDRIHAALKNQIAHSNGIGFEMLGLEEKADETAYEAYKAQETDLAGAKLIELQRAQTVKDSLSSPARSRRYLRRTSLALGGLAALADGSVMDALQEWKMLMSGLFDSKIKFLEHFIEHIGAVQLVGERFAAEYHPGVIVHVEANAGLPDGIWGEIRPSERRFNPQTQTSETHVTIAINPRKPVPQLQRIIVHELAHHFEPSHAPGWRADLAEEIRVSRRTREFFKTTGNVAALEGALHEARAAVRKEMRTGAPAKQPLTSYAFKKLEEAFNLSDEKVKDIEKNRAAFLTAA